MYAIIGFSVATLCVHGLTKMMCTLYELNELNVNARHRRVCVCMCRNESIYLLFDYNLIENDNNRGTAFGMGSR